MGAVLVTGGAGYIGSHAAKALMRAGHEVVIYDDLSAGHREAVRDAVLVEGDIRDTERVGAALRCHRIDAVMHFAARLDVGESVRDPSGYFGNNVTGALSVLEAMVREEVRRFVFSSTCAVFGTPRETPIVEDHPTSPINAYGESKLAVERALPHFERAYGLRFISLRYFNAAGADPEGELGEHHDPEIHLIPRALDAASGGVRLEIFGTDYPTPDGTCLRDYVHVADLAEAHLLALGALEDGGSSAVYNVGNGRPHSVLDVIACVEAVVGRRVPRRIGPRRPGDPAVLFASNEKIQRELGWTPRYADLDRIVATAWRWRQSNPAGYRLRRQQV